MAALVGRDEEQRLAREALARPAPTGILFAGAMGVGKTALARAVVEDADTRGWATAWTVGTGSGSAIPLGALASLLSNSTGDSAAGDSATFLGGPDSLRTARLSIAERARGRGLVIGVDDAHLLDPASAVVVLQLLSSGAASVVATVRSGEPAPDAIVALWKDGLVERTELQTLSRDESAELTRALLEGQIEAALVDSLWRLSGGNPLYLRELVLAGRAAGRIALERGQWRRRGAWAVGSRLVELVAARLAGLAPEALAAVEVVAVAEVVPLAVLARLAPEAAIEEAERRGLIHTEIDTVGAQVRPAHPIYGEVARAGLPGARAMAVRGQLADAIQEAGLHLGAGLLSFVTWRLEAGERVPTGLLTKAAGRACQRGNPALGHRLAQTAIEQGGGIDAGLALALALHLEGKGQEALTLLEGLGLKGLKGLEGLEGAGGGDDECSRVAVLRAFILQLHLGRSSEAEAVLAGAESLVTDAQCLTRLAATKAALLAYAHLDPELNDLALDAGDPTSPTRRFVVHALGPAFALSGQTQAAIGAAEQILAAGASLVGVFPTLLTSYIQAGRVDDLEGLARTGYEQASDKGDEQWQAFAALGLGLAALMRGRARSAIPFLQEAAAGPGTWSIVPQMDVAAAALTVLAEASALAGDLDGAEEALEVAATKVDHGQLAVATFIEPMLMGARATLATARGERSRALSLAHQGAAAARANRAAPIEVQLLHTLIRLGAAREVLDRAAKLAKAVDGPYATLVAALAGAVVAANGDGIDQVADGFEAAAMLLHAAGAAAQASTAHARAGHTARAVASRLRAKRLLADCEVARPPWLTEAEEASPLTTREEEVAVLAVAGLPSREIARRLVVSVRTVDSHLARVYAKLGVTGRQDLAETISRSASSRV